MYYFMCYSDILFILGTRHTITPELISLYIEEIFNDFLSSLFSTTIENDVDVPTATTTTTITIEVDDNIRNNNTNTSTIKQLKKIYNAYNILQSHELIDNFLFNNVGIWDRDIPEVPIVEYNIEQTELNIIKLDRHMKNLSFNKLASMDEVHQQIIDTQDDSSSSSHDLAIHDTLNTVKSKINDKFFYYIDNNNEHLKKMMMFKNNLDELFHIESIEKERMMEILHSWVITFSVLMLYICILLY